MRRIPLTLLLVALIGTASGIPLLPAEFSGTVTIDGSPAPAGTVITARIGDRDCGSLTLTTAGAFGGDSTFDKRLLVSGEDGDAGKTITFLVDGKPAGTAVYTPGTSTSLTFVVTKGGTSGGTSSGSSGDGGGGGSSAPMSAATVTGPTATNTPDIDEEGTVRHTTPETTVATAPLTDPTLTSGPVTSATAVQRAGLPFPWLTGLAALAGAAFLLRNRG